MPTPSPRPLPKIKLIYPDGAIEWYRDCEIDSSLIPDLSFTGTHTMSECREKILTNLAYKIISEPVPTSDQLAAAMSRPPE